MSEWVEAAAPSKLNLTLVVGPSRDDGKHEVVTVLQRLELADTVAIRPAARVTVRGFATDTLVTRALETVAGLTRQTFEARIAKRVPVAAGLGGGSSDAATALRLANASLGEPLPFDELHAIAVALGSDVPFFLRDGPCLATGDGSRLEPVTLPQDYAVLLVLPAGSSKTSTRDVYARFDERSGAVGYERRRGRLLNELPRIASPRELAGLPNNDLAESPLAAELLGLGAFRADVTGAGPVVYGLFDDDDAAREASLLLEGHSHQWLTRPAA